MLWTFVPVAVLLSLTPGPGMALVVRNAAVRGTGAAARTTVGSSIGVGAGDPARRDFASGLLTALANPKLAVFFLALFPQFIPDGAPVLPYALAMAAILVAADFVCYVSLGAVVARASRSLASSRLARRVERLTGAVLLALAGRLAYETR